MSKGTTFDNRFTTTELIADRSAAAVWKADDSQTGGAAAVKIFKPLPSEPDGLPEKYQSEVTRLQSIDHPAFVKILSAGRGQSSYYLAMELVGGTSLRDLLKQQSAPLPVDRALHVAKSVAAALDAIKQAGSFHAHLDSRAVLIDGERVVTAGILPHCIKEASSSSGLSGQIVLDAGYASPEQVSGSGAVDHRSDIYALATLLFEMLTGKRPFASENPMQAAMLRMTKDAPAPSADNPLVPVHLDAAVKKALSREPNERFQSFSEFSEALEVGGTSGSGTITHAVPPHLSKEKEAAAEQTAPNPAGEAAGGKGSIGLRTVAMSTDKIKKLLAQRGADPENPSTEELPAPNLSDMPQARVVGPKADDGTISDDAGMEAPTGQQTMVDLSSEDMLTGSFIAVQGPRRGERYPILDEQIIIGSGAGCKLTLKGKDVPARGAIIVKRDGDYIAAPLAANGVALNGEPMEGSDEVVLKRGDVLRFGEHQLRFVAPGEVFTLQDEVADRVIDRPPSKVNFAVKVTTAAVAVVCVLMFFLFQSSFSDRQAAEKTRARTEAQKRKEVVAKLRMEGDAFLKDGKLIEPIGANARKRFEQILEIDPDDTYAKRRIAEIRERARELSDQRRKRAALQQKVGQLLKQANGYYTDGDFISPPGANAKEAYQEVLRMDPDNELARARLKKVNSVLSQLLGRVKDMLAKAEEYRDAGQIIDPPKRNVYELLREILTIDQDNVEAKDMLLDVAAESIYQGDRAKAKADPSAMRSAYLQAQALGVDPQYLAPRLKGVELMKRSRASVVIYDRKSQAAGKPGDDKNDYLSTSEIERRIAALELQDSLQDSGGGRKFIELNKK